MKDLKKISEQLSKDLDKYDWFYSCEADKDCIFVYVNIMSKEILEIIPDFVDGVHIKCAFSGYLLCGEKYGIEGAGKKIRIDLNELN